MTYFNKYKDVEVGLPPLNTRFSGEFKIETFRGVEFPKGSGQVFEIAGTRRTRMDWTPNLILNQGLDNYANYGGFRDLNEKCVVGTSSTGESVDQTGCIAPVAYAGDAYSGFQSVSGSALTPPYYGWVESKHRYAPGFGGGNININEISISHNTGNNLTEINDDSNARALTRDGNGDPTTITVLADEYLDVYYRRRQYVGLITAAGVVQPGTGTIDIGGVSTAYDIRPYRVTGSGWRSACDALYLSSYFSGDFGRGTVWSGDAAHTSDPTDGGPAASDSDEWFYTYPQGYGSYTPGSYKQSVWMQSGLDNLNLTGGIGACALSTSRGWYVSVLDPVIPKDNTKIFTWYQEFSWSRYTI